MNLTNQFISSSYQSLLQVSGSGVVTDGTGSIITSLELVAATASYISPAVVSSSIAQSGFASTGSNIFVGTQTFSGSLLPAGPYSSNTSSYNLGSPTAAWKDLFVSNGSIYFITGSKSASIGLVGDNFVFTGAGLSIPTNQALFGYLQGTASYALNAAGAQIETGSFATTGSNRFKGDIVVEGDLTAKQIIVSSSVYYVTESYSSGSTKFGNSSDDTHQFTGSLQISGSITGSLFGTASYISPTFISASAAAAGFGQGSGAGFPYSGSAVITGSLVLTQGLTVSQSISAYNINAGTPSSNAWQSNLGGSYFNNFTSNTSVSEILRFIAGLLSGSAPDASPNTKTYSTISKTTSNNGTGTISGAIPQNSSASDITYLISKGFAQTGSVIFNGLTVYSNSSYSNVYTSVSAGSTSVSSSIDTQLFGLGSIVDANTPNTFYVSGTLNWRFDESSAQTPTATSQSQALLSNSTFSTSNGLTVGKIPTANAAVIPAAYQDGKFASIFSSGLFNNGRSYTSVSSSGYYHISSSIKIASGSSGYSTAATSYDKIFWAPVSSITIPTQTLTVPTATTASLTMTSASLSGAPFIKTATWTQNAQVNGVFNPLYTTNTNVAYMSGPGGLVTLSATSPGNYISNVASNGNINTTNTVYDSTGATVRSVSTVPYETDIIKLSGSLSFDAGSSSSTNITATSVTPTTFTVSTLGINRSGATGVTNTQTYNYHNPGDFGQPLSSGSMAYFGFPTVTADTATSDTFKDEANRIQLNDSMLTFAGTAFVSGSRLKTYDLQVKPGYLVDAGGTRRYWYPSGYGDTYKYYVRRFKRTSSIASFTVNVGQTLVAWDDTTTTNGVSIGIIFESAVNGQNGLTTTRIFDPYYTTGLVASNVTANTAGTNPFGSAIDLYGIRTGAVSGTTYTVEVSNANKVYMNGSTYDEFYLIIRYKGEPTTAVTTLSVS